MNISNILTNYANSSYYRGFVQVRLYLIKSGARLGGEDIFVAGYSEDDAKECL